MPFKLFTSNRLEILCDALVESFDAPLASPFEEEIIIVQSRGMERWISMELAGKLGICANVRFPFPNTFIYELMRKVFPDLPEKSVYEPRFLTWKIMHLLPRCMEQPEFRSLKEYVEGPGGNMKQLQLSVRVADLFDQYLLFRPEMIFGWEKGKENHWQAALWRELARGNEELHRAALGKKLIGTLQKRPPGSANLPTRISVFGISALPEFHLQVFNALTKVAEVHIFLLNPSQEYWGDIVSDWEIRRAARKKKDRDLTMELFHFEKGNSLLASMGKLGRDFFDLIEGSFDYEPYEQFQDPGEDTLLARVQSDILNLRDRELTNDPKQTVSKSDKTLQIHSCHSPRREVEVLQDYLLDLFADDPELKPRDILVMAPDIEPYAAYIEAVFDLPFSDAKRIPYSIADRSYGKENEVVETFLAILNLHNGRFGAARVLTILESPAVQKKFNLSEDDLELIHTWVRETRIRWGKDAQHRGELGLPEISQNTWRSGLERLLLGYALPCQEETLYENKILPYNNVEGGGAVALGKLLEFVERLFERVDALERKRTLRTWHTELGELLDAFFVSEDEAVPALQAIRLTLAEFDDFQDLSGFEDELDLSVVKHYLESKLRTEGYGYGFLTGGVTFCSMLPMRSIPARVICLIGMNSDAYPRGTNQLGFDLMAKLPRKGDRSRRNDDRYLFLEALLSARDKFYISYVGQSIKDNATIPPSVVVGEVIDYLEANFQVDGQSCLNQVLTRHRLQAFSPEYFKSDQDRLFSYSPESMQAAHCLLAERQQPAPFFAGPLPEPEDDFKTVTLDDLYRFFRNPAQFLFNKRLGIRFEENEVVLEEKEAFALKGLDYYDVGKDLLEKSLAGKEVAGLKSLKMASGQLPHGAIGEYEYQRLSQRVKHFISRTQPYLQGNEIAPIAFDLELDEFRLVGKLDKISANGLVVFRYARVRGKDHLFVWIRHLALSTLQENGLPRESFLAGIDSVKDGNWLGWKLKSVPNSKEILTQLLQIYWFGLARPLRFFPDSSMEFVRQILSGSKPSYALWQASQCWRGSDRARGEREDLYFQQCFGRERNPLNEQFQRLAKRVYEPILAHEEELI